MLQSVMRGVGRTGRVLNGGGRRTLSDTVVRSPFKDLQLPKCTVPQLIWQDLHNWPEKTAVECGITGKKFTYSQVHTMSFRLASSLLNMGFRAGDVITVILPNMCEYAITILGAMEAGLVPSPINPLYTPDEIFHQVKDSDAKVIIAHPDTLMNTVAAVEKYGKNIPIICIHDWDGKARQLPDKIIPFSYLTRDGINISNVSHSTQKTDLNETSFLPYSSGTTGLPKGVCLTHSSITSNIEQIGHPDMSHVEKATNESQDVLPGILPFFHIYGFCVALLQGLRKGSKIVTLPKFEPERFLSILEKNENMVLHVVPPMILFLGSHPSVKQKHLEHVKCLITGGAPCGATDIERILQRTNTYIVQGYGMTEASPLLTFTRPGSKNIASVGPPICNTLGKIKDMATGKDLPAGEIGELCFKGPQIMKGYFKQPEATKAMIDDDGWLHTGDTGYYDKNGDFYIVDRTKELIKVKGFQVAPAELEAVLREHTKISDAGVVGIPSSKTGEEPVGFVVPKPGSTVNIAEIKEFVAHKVAKYKQISKIVIVDVIPRSASGKILRKELKKMASEMAL